MNERCDQVGPLLPWYAAGTASEPERATVSEHLVNCVDCVTLLELARSQAVGPPIDRLLAAPLSPQLLVDLVERPESLPAQTRQESRERLTRDPLAREAYERLLEVEAALAGAPALHSVLSAAPTPRWRRPLAAAGYLAAAAVLAGVLFLRSPDGAPVIAPGVMLVPSERSQRAPGDGAHEAALMVRGAVRLRLQTDLPAEDLADPTRRYRVALEYGGKPVWSADRSGSDFMLEPPFAVLEVVILSDRLVPGRDYELVIRALAPGDLIDGQALFTRHLRSEGAR